MTDTDFDTALVASAFRIAGEQGWHKVNAVAAAHAADLSVAEARARFPAVASILLKFGRLADQAALRDLPAEGTVRDRLFDLLMQRFDFLQAHREGVRALLRALPGDPLTAMLLTCSTRRSMRWMLQAAGVDATGPRGDLQTHGLLAVWLWAVRAWESDKSEDLSGTMAAVDSGLQRAEGMASWLGGSRPAPPPPPAKAGAGEIDPANPPADTGPVPMSGPDGVANPPPPVQPPQSEPPDSGPTLPDESV
jgi:ubiquinone biosynthesis protein COQ9